MTLLHEEYNSERKAQRNNSKSLAQISMNERKSDLLEKKIEKKDIIEKNRVLHQSQMQKLKRDQKILEAQLKEVKQETCDIAKKQAQIFK